MSERKFKEALQIFAESVTFMSFNADQPEESDFGTHQEQRDRCALKFAFVKACWGRDLALLARLEHLTNESIKFYAAGNFDKDHKAVMGIDEILWTFMADFIPTLHSSGPPAAPAEFKR